MDASESCFVQKTPGFFSERGPLQGFLKGFLEGSFGILYQILGGCDFLKSGTQKAQGFIIRGVISDIPILIFIIRGFIWEIPILIFAYVLFWGPT